MPILELTAVSKHFGGLPAVDDVSFDVTEGRVLAVIGPNGAGKSTLLKAISGMHQPTSGTITFDGDDITGLPSHTIRQRGIAKVLQHPRVFHSMSVRDNAALGAMFGTPGGRRGEPEALRAGDDALDLVGLADKGDWQVGQLNLHQQRILVGGDGLEIACRYALFVTVEGDAAGPRADQQADTCPHHRPEGHLRQRADRAAGTGATPAGHGPRKRGSTRGRHRSCRNPRNFH